MSVPVPLFRGAVAMVLLFLGFVGICVIDEWLDRHGLADLVGTLLWLVFVWLALSFFCWLIFTPIPGR